MNKKLKNKTIPTLIILFLFSILILGCAQQQAPNKTTRTTTSQTNGVADDSPEAVLVREIADGKLVEVYDEYVRVGPGKEKENWMIISNVHDKTQTFKVFPCEGCIFKETEFTIRSGAYEIISFDVLAQEGQKEIRVKDKLNNAYGFAKISVIVE